MINVKNSRLEYFEIFKKSKKAKNYLQDCNDFELKEKIREDLLQKQHNQCAYCERKIDKKNSHIEHIRQRDKFHQFECEYSNLVLSCNDENSCGKYKDSQKNPIAKFWQDEFIHPVFDNPEEYFSFNEDGQILATKENATRTIKYLNLNSLKLIRSRKSLLLQLIYMKDIDNLLEYFNEFENLLKEYLG
jgi:uncharacterized protein (TIGR02646 family)